MPQFWKGGRDNGHRVRFALQGDQQRESDLVFFEERPYAVLEWSATGAATVTVELDPAKLRPADPSGRVYEYSEKLSDPR